MHQSQQDVILWTTDVFLGSQDSPQLVGVHGTSRLTLYLDP